MSDVGQSSLVLTSCVFARVVVARVCSISVRRDFLLVICIVILCVDYILLVASRDFGELASYIVER